MSEATKRQYATPPVHWKGNGVEVFVLEAVERFVFRYELVRRITRLLNDPNTKRLVKPVQLRQLQKAKPFEALGFMEQQIVLYQFYRDAGEKPVTTTSEYLLKQFGGYSEPFPQIHFDLHASPNAIKQTVLKWFREQQRKAGVSDARPLGKKGKGVSRNQKQNYQPVSWHHLDWLDSPEDHKLKAKGHAAKLRERLLAQALKALPTVIVGLKLIKAEAETDSRHSRRYYCMFRE